MAADGPRIRPFEAGDVEGFLRAKCVTFEASLLENERRRWRVEFDSNPAAPAPFPRGFVVEEAGTIRGGIAFLPYRVQIGGEVVVAACGIDLCVEPRLRGQGLGRELLRRWLDPTLAPFAFTIATSAATLAISRSLGADVRGGADGPVAWVRHGDAAHEPPPPRELLATAIVAELPPDSDELAAAARRDERLVVVRDAAYLRWRWRDVPFGGVTTIRASAGGATRGLAFVQDDERKGCGYLADLLHQPGDEAAQRSLVRRAVAASGALGRGALWHLTRDRRSEALLREEGFVPFEGPLPQFVAKVNRPRSDGAAGAVAGGVQPSEWSPSLGDTDMLFNCNEPRPAASNDPHPAACNEPRPATLSEPPDVR